MLTEMVKFGHKTKEEIKAIQSAGKESIQGTNSEGKETGTQINGLDQKEEINFQQEQNKETRIQKMWRGLGISGETLNVPRSES